MIFPEETQSAAAAPATECIDWAYDPATDSLKLKNGRHYTVSGTEALKTWIYKALRTQAGRFSAYSADFGTELAELRGSADRELLASELESRIEEALLKSPYISAVKGFETTFSGGAASISFTVMSAAGELSISDEPVLVIEQNSY